MQLFLIANAPEELQMGIVQKIFYFIIGTLIYIYLFVEISGSFGLDIVRIGQMGEQCRSHNLFKTLYALGMSFSREGVKLDVAQGMAALEEGLR